jgi:hypothetical protein
MQLNPITRICLQTADGYYSLPFDETMGLVIIPGTGAVLVVHAGATHQGITANFRTSVSPEQQATLAALMQPIQTVKPGDDLTAMLATGALVELPDGHYPAFDVVSPI